MQRTTRDGGAELSFPDGWTVDGARRASIVVRTKDFVAAVELIDKIAEVAEELGHHPDLHLTGYNELRVETWSHDKGGLTTRDVRLAERVDALIQDAGVERR